MAINTLRGKHVYLRALEPEDLHVVFNIENREDLWELSGTQAPYSLHLLKEYLDNAHKDIYEVKQLRFAICPIEDDKVVGLIDIFDFSPQHHRAGVGILITEEGDRRKGYAREALGLVLKYAFQHLDLHQIYANILEDNSASIKLFEKAGFKKIGLKRDWRRFRESYKNELLYQLIN